jgi:hypothetical protein
MSGALGTNWEKQNRNNVDQGTIRVYENWQKVVVKCMVSAFPKHQHADQIPVQIPAAKDMF